ncbi:hypothetical protein CROQUDRAFT_41474 [Cronartium quercuum f. sp. fusiforme G11]|uniref:Nudix hydrolase domain-containing protein n=1 Tax=Cronartium quercuum f. sp. fusiforme G11 TaxID=708437 RepID=A0A9P6TE18_9BASI|nr:hypothetical protein CROQUDRAFT_41474 [Cronartium quercuum f. sp. fusiforme G11]
MKHPPSVNRFYEFLHAWDPEPNSGPPSTHGLIPAEFTGLSRTSITALQRLLKHRPQPDKFPLKRRAAVMIGLFTSRHGHLNVLLTKRSSTMRSYAGQTALPGGKMETSDPDLEYTSRREAWEECGVTRDPKKVIKLTVLEPFLSRGNLIVTPVVFFIADQTLMPRLNAREVDVLFSHPLEGFLVNQNPSEHLNPESIKLPAIAINPISTALSGHPTSGPYLCWFEHSWFPQRIPYRFFEFQSKSSPILGFTADVLIEAAQIAYGREPSFERRCPGQWGMDQIIELALKEADEFQTDDQATNVQKHDLLEGWEELRTGMFSRIAFMSQYLKRWPRKLVSRSKL